MHPMLNIAVKAARKAGPVITRASEDIERLTINKRVTTILSVRLI